MRCKHCNYLLFNLPQPVCPECGRPFDLEDYVFKPGDVSFNCPHCDQDYYGNDPQGLPWPRNFQCVRCGQPVSLPGMRVVPRNADAMGVLRDQYVGDRSPWDRREELGLVSAWWETLMQTLLRPATFYRTHSGTSLAEAWLFSMISMYVGSVPRFLCGISLGWTFWYALAKSGSPFAPSSGTPFAPAPGMPVVPAAGAWALAAYQAASLAFTLISPLFVQFIGSAIWACTIQLALSVIAPERKSIGHTYRTAMYSFGVHALGLIPVCGAEAAWVWQSATLVSGIKEVHGISRGKAAFAVLWPGILVLFAALGLILWLRP